MTAETDLPPLPERFNYTNSSAHWCYSRYTMTRDDRGDYVLAEDYDALRNASEALRAEVDKLRDVLKEMITWIPSADTYRRLGFDPAAPMRALERARAALAKENSND